MWRGSAANQTSDHHFRTSHYCLPQAAGHTHRETNWSYALWVLFSYMWRFIFLISFLYLTHFLINSCIHKLLPWITLNLNKMTVTELRKTYWSVLCSKSSQQFEIPGVNRSSIIQIYSNTVYKVFLPVPLYTILLMQLCICMDTMCYLLHAPQ